MKLSEGKINNKYIIKEIKKCAMQARLYEIGFVEGQSVRLLKYSPLKNMVLLEIRNSTLAVNYDILSCVEVK